MQSDRYVLSFQKNLLLMTNEAGCCDTLVHIWHTTWHLIPEDSNLQTHYHENLKSHHFLSSLYTTSVCANHPNQKQHILSRHSHITSTGPGWHAYNSITFHKERKAYWFDRNLFHTVFHYMSMRMSQNIPN
jgi:hypothetical protein